MFVGAMSVRAMRYSRVFLASSLLWGFLTCSSAGAYTVVAVMHGASGDFDLPNLRGMQLAVSEVAARGGGLKGEKLTLQTVSPDGAIPTWEVSAYLLGASLTSAEVLKVATATRSSGAALVLAGQGGAGVLPSLGGRGILVGFGDNAQAAAAAQFALKRGWKSVMVMSQSDHPQSQDLTRYFRDAFHALGGGMLLSQNDDSAGGDLKNPEVARRLRAALKSVDALYLAAGNDDVSDVVRNLRSIGVTLPILGPDRLEFSLPSDLSAAQLGELYATVHTLISKNASGPLGKLMERYSGAYNSPLQSSFTVVGYDALQLVVEAASKAGSAKANAVLAALNSMGAVQGIAGSQSFQAGSRVFSTDIMVMVRLTNAGQVLASAEPLTYLPKP
jgi:branched-chain amino acid transport system substrate-binding protein